MIGTSFELPLQYYVRWHNTKNVAKMQFSFEIKSAFEMVLKNNKNFRGHNQGRFS